MKKRGWDIQQAEVQGVHLDVEKKIIRFDKKRYMLRLESTSILHIYGLKQDVS